MEAVTLGVLIFSAILGFGVVRHFVSKSPSERVADENDGQAAE